MEYCCRLAHELYVRVQLPDDEIGGRLRALETSGDQTELTLRVGWLRGRAADLSESAEDPARFWGRLRWTGSHTADFAVPAGRGHVYVDASGASTVELLLDPADPERGFGSALRLSLALGLAARGDYLVHAAACAVGREAVLLLGESGAGKTSSARRLGREGALRLADDLVLVRADGDQLWLEVCQFDRAAALPGRTGRWLLATAYRVQKCAPSTRIAALEGSMLSTWTSALFMPAPQPVRAAGFLDGVWRLAQSVPLRTLHAAPRGPLLPAVQTDLVELSARR